MNEQKHNVASEIYADYESRLLARAKHDAQWKLNANFVQGNQFVGVLPGGTLVPQNKTYVWEEQQAFNHVAGIMDTRLAHLARVRPKLLVRPFSNDESDVTAASVSGKILDSAFRKIGLYDKIQEATAWSELTGTAFYKLSWDVRAGMKVGETDEGEIFEGDVRVDVCPPQEIFPDSLERKSVADCHSIIHARSMHIVDVERIWGVKIQSSVQNSSLSEIFSSGEQAKGDYVTVIERFTRPSNAHKNGRHEVVAGGEILYEGDLPYLIGEDGKRDLPFVRQRSMPSPGSFFGVSPVERAIPVQRAYNAVKNRKHEFMNRIASGVLVVEDGSVDVEDLEDEGLNPGKVIVYKEGTTPPKFLEPGSIPNDFSVEEEQLLNEFAEISGVSELMSTSAIPKNVTSGTALQLIAEQDDVRMSVSADEIRSAVKILGKFMLRLYRQCASENRLTRFVGESGEVEMIAWSKSLLASDDIQIDWENQPGDTATGRRNTLLKLMEAGLFSDSTGKLDESARYRILQAFGFASVEQARGVADLHRLRAKAENAAAAKKSPEIEDYDDHAAHVDCHVAFILSGECKNSAKIALKKHIAEHKKALKEEKNG